MKAHRLDANFEINQALAKNRIFGQRLAAALDRFSQSQQAIEALLAAAGGAEHVALMEQRGIGDDPSFVEFADQIFPRHVYVVEKNFVEAAVAGHLYQRT